MFGEKIEPETSNPNVINLDNLGASAIGSGANISNSTLAWLGLLGIIVLASTTVLLLHKRKTESLDGENLSADDMKIVE